jgi:hypothetical protein
MQARYIYMAQSDEINELAKALSAFQSQVGGAKKDSTNPFFKSSYADLESVWEAIREPLAKNLLSITQTLDYFETAEGVVVDVLETQLNHPSGQWKNGRHALKPTKPDPQSQGSAITYARRYGLTAILGVYQTDDDGEAAQSSHREAQQSDRPKYSTSSSSTGNGTKTPPLSASTEAFPEPTLEDWDGLLNTGTQNGWSEALIRMNYDKVRRNGASPLAAFANCKKKYSEKNASAAAEHEDLLAEAEKAGF